MTFSTFVYICIVGGVRAFLWWFFARSVIGRGRIASGNRAPGLFAWEDMQNKDTNARCRGSSSPRRSGGRSTTRATGPTPTGRISNDREPHFALTLCCRADQTVQFGLVQ